MSKLYAICGERKLKQVDLGDGVVLEFEELYVQDLAKFISDGDNKGEQFSKLSKLLDERLRKAAPNDTDYSKLTKDQADAAKKQYEYEIQTTLKNNLNKIVSAVMGDFQKTFDGLELTEDGKKKLGLATNLLSQKETASSRSSSPSGSQE